MFYTIHLLQEEWLSDIASGSARLFGVNPTTEGECRRLRQGEIRGRVDVCCSRADALVRLSLNMPVFALVYGIIGRHIDLPDLQHKLTANVPEIFPEVNEHGVLIALMMAKVSPAFVSLLW